MRIFVVPQVSKLMRQEAMPVTALCRVAREVIAGTLGAGETDLGGGLFKKRVARPGGGKRGGYRLILAYRPPRIDRVVLLYGFAKNAAATLTPDGRAALTIAADELVTTDDEQLATLSAAGRIAEVMCDDAV